MKLKDLAQDHIRNHALCPGTVNLTEWMDKKWLTAEIGGGVVKVIPLWGVKNALSIHDMHHVLTGYDTSVDGEIELAAWELGSGGCRWNLLFWIDRVLLTAYGLLARRSLTMCALQRGRSSTNLYGVALSAVLERDVAALKRELNV